MSSMSAYFATVFRLTWSIRAISDLERPAASIDRISFTVSRGTVISSILPGRARQSNRPGKPYGEGRAPGPRGAALLLKLLNFSCSRCLFPSDHSDHFLVNINSSEGSSWCRGRQWTPTSSRGAAGNDGGDRPGSCSRPGTRGSLETKGAQARPRGWCHCASESGSYRQRQASGCYRKPAPTINSRVP